MFAVSGAPENGMASLHDVQHERLPRACHGATCFFLTTTSHIVDAIRSNTENPRRLPRSRNKLAQAAGGHLEQGDDDRAYDAAYHYRHEDDHDGFDQAGHSLDADVDFFIIGVGDALQQLLQLAGLFAHRHHVAHHGREDAALLDRRADVRALHDAVVDALDHLLHRAVAHDLLYDPQRL